VSSTTHLEEASIAREAGSKGGEPPKPVRNPVAKGVVEGKKAGGAAHVAMAQEDGGTGFRLFFGELEFAAEGAEHFTAPGMPDPTGNFLRPAAMGRAGPVKDRPGVAGRKGGNFHGKKIPEQATAVVETEMLPVFRGGVTGGSGEADRRASRGGLTTEQGGCGPIPKKAGADEDPGIVVQIRGGGADFHAGHKDMAGVPGLKESGGLIERRKSGPTTLSHQIQQSGGNGQTQRFGYVAGKSGAKVAGAGGDQQGINFFRRDPRPIEGLLSRLGGKLRGVTAKTCHHRIGMEHKGLPNFVQGKKTALDAVFSGQDFAKEVAGFFRELSVGGILLEGLEHVRLSERSGWDGKAKGLEEHGEIKIKIKLKGDYRLQDAG